MVEATDDTVAEDVWAVDAVGDLIVIDTPLATSQMLIFPDWWPVTKVPSDAGDAVWTVWYDREVGASPRLMDEDDGLRVNLRLALLLLTRTSYTRTRLSLFVVT